MSIYQKILEWSLGRPLWQRDALRRIMQQDRLSEKDYDELVAICIGKAGVVAQPLDASHIPQVGSAGGPVWISKLHSCLNINSLVPGQELTFSRNGLTVIYGDNGSGKSSYARIVKKLCRARGNSESDTLCSNVFETASGPSSAILEYSVDDQPEPPINWTNTTNAPDVLSQVSFFDCYTASAYIKEDLDVAYTPAGLDVLHRLAEEACGQVRARIEREIDRVRGALPEKPRISAGTTIADFIENLSYETNEDEIKRYAQWDSTNEEALKKAQADLEHIRSEDPSKRAQNLRRQSTRFQSLVCRLAEQYRSLRNESLEELSMLRKTVARKKELADFASTQAFADEPLKGKGIGTEIWQALWEAARNYSQKQAYPGKDFPNIEDNTRCVLCHQELEQEAKDRFVRFDKFVKEDAAKEHQSAKKTLQDFLEPFSTMIIRGQDDETTLDEIGQYSSDLKDRIIKYIKASEKRLEIVLETPTEVLSEDSPDFKVDIFNDLLKLAERLKNESEQIDPTKHEQNIVALKKLIDEISAKKTLHENLEKVLQRLASLKSLAALEKSKTEDTRTNEITRKNSDFTKETVTDALLEAFQNELTAINATSIPVELTEERGDRGAQKYRISLRNAVNEDFGASKILSEGEQRAVALAAFFSELTLSEHPSSIVLDDPISSLDHVRRKAVVRRLVKEAKQRQIIVFTHNIAFLCELYELHQNLVGYCHVYSVDRFTNGQAGKCAEGVPFKQNNFKGRVKSLKVEIDTLGRELDQNESQITQTKYDEMLIPVFEKIRSTWERGIEEVLFDGVLERFDKAVHMTKVGNLDIEPIDIEEAKLFYAKCCDYLHDPSLHADRQPCPPIDDVKDDLNSLDDWAKRIRKRRKDRDEAKKNAGNPISK